MADGTGIEWTDATWNIITGCSVVSPGCTNCYAMKLAGTRLQNHPSRAGLTRPSKAGPVWTGEVRFNEQWLDQPLRWSRPRKVFVCAHGDLFHEKVPDEWLDRVFAVMALAPQHVFQVLTKRPDRMRAYLCDTHSSLPGLSTLERIALAAESLNGEGLVVAQLRQRWPLPNVWLGTSVEDQERSARLVDLLLTPAAVRWVSAEPLLGPLDLRKISTMRFRGAEVMNALTGTLEGLFGDYCSTRLPGLDWVVVGGESGPGARPMHPAWARSLRDQCSAAGVAMLFKQHGDWAPFESNDILERCAPERGGKQVPQMETVFEDPADRAGEQQSMWRIGKKEAGRLLDGREWNGYPEGEDYGVSGARAVE